VSLRWLTILLVILAIAALVGGTILVGARLLGPKPLSVRAPVHLAYGLDGSVYVADMDGTNPVRIADGVYNVGGGGPTGCGGYWGEGPMWSPDGRHLAYRSAWDPSTWGSCPTNSGAGFYISDPEGHRVGPLPGSGWRLSWSPDSTRVATWLDLGKTIAIYGLDGVRQSLLTVPDGCPLPGDFDPVWSRDGTSLVIATCAVPLDGRTPARLPDDDPRRNWQWAYSPDGALVAYVDALSLGVARADGSQARVLVPTGQAGTTIVEGVAVEGVDDFIWSADGDRIAFDASEDTGPSPPRGLFVVDVATGTVTPLVIAPGTDSLMVVGFSPGGDRIIYWRVDTSSVGTGLFAVDVATGTVTPLVSHPGTDSANVIGISPGGDQILFSTLDANSGGTGLWSVDANGDHAQLLVAGTDWGEWQPAPTDR